MLEELPFAKPRRIRDRKVLKLYARKHPRCEVSGCRWRPMPEPHHIKPRSLGGADADENLCSLCRLHHIGDEGVHSLGHREWFRRFGARLTNETRAKAIVAGRARAYEAKLADEAREKVRTALRIEE